MTGSITGVGVGPGDPDLMTFRAAEAIRSADCIAFLQADGRPSRALTIAAGHLPAGAERLPIGMPMRPEPAAGQAVYDGAARMLAARADSGRRVAVLCEGDPLLYGSFIHLLERLRPAHEPDVVPGVPSFLAAAAAARLPLVRRSESLAILPGTLGEAELARRLAASDCAAVLKTGRHLPAVRRALDAAGMGKNAVVVEEVGGMRERICPLDGLNADGLPYFAIVLAHRSVAR